MSSKNNADIKCVLMMQSANDSIFTAQVQQQKTSDENGTRWY